MLFNKFLGYFSLKTGTRIIGWTTIVLHILCAVFNNRYTSVFGANGGNLYYNLFGIMSSMMMINGAKEVSLIA